jgi:hypothetical protein
MPLALDERSVLDKSMTALLSAVRTDPQFRGLRDVAGLLLFLITGRL